MFRKMPFILLAILCAIVFFDPIMPLQLKKILYALSLSIKSIILFCLPLIVFGLLFKATATLANQATKIIGLIFIAVCGSNFLSTFLSHYVGDWIYHFDLSIIVPQERDSLQPAWFFDIPKLISNDKAMLLAVVSGIFFSSFKPLLTAQILRKFDWIIGKIFSSFVYLIPLFVAGSMVKLQFDGAIQVCMKEYAIIFAFVAIAQFVYILCLYFLLSGGKKRECFHSLKNMLPAAISGFSTMSSAASMPLTIIGVENNTQNKDIARSVVPATVNIHLVGDCFAIPIFAYAVLKNFGYAEPLLGDFLIFASFFVIAKFSVAAVPGGGILVMLPILETYLGFTAEMLSLITALYILFDPVITCINVLGNGAFAKMIDKAVLFLGFMEKNPKT